MTISEALPNLRANSAAHAFSTLVVMAEESHAGPDEYDERITKPTGHILAAGDWLAHRCGIGRNTVSRHLAALVSAGELAVWEPYNRRQGRAAEYVVLRMMTRRGRAELKRREVFRKKRPPKTKAQWSPPTTTTGPSDAFAETGENPSVSRNPLPAPPVVTTGGDPLVSARGPVFALDREEPNKRSHPYGAADPLNEVMFTSEVLLHLCPEMSRAEAGRFGKCIDAFCERTGATDAVMEVVADFRMGLDPLNELVLSPREAWDAIKDDSGTAYRWRFDGEVPTGTIETRSA